MRRRSERKNFDGCKSIVDELTVFIPHGQRSRDIFLKRVIGEEMTLLELGRLYDITKERVRQLSGEEINRANEILSSAPPLSIRHALKIAADMGAGLSLMAWKASLITAGILGEYPEGSELAGTPPFERLVLFLKNVVLAIVPERRRLNVPDRLVELLQQNRSLAVSTRAESSALFARANSPAAYRVNLNGAVSTAELVDETGLPVEMIVENLRANGYMEVAPGWFTFTDKSDFIRSSFEIACEKLAAAIDQIPLDLFYEGVSLFVSKRKGQMPPVPVFAALLPVQGLAVKLGMVRVVRRPDPGCLSDSEILFLEALKEIGPVLSTYDLIYKFKASQKSISSATRSLLSGSPLPERLQAASDVARARGHRISFYILRGAQVSEEDILKAIERNALVESNTDVRVIDDDLLDYHITVGHYASLAGVLNAARLKELNGDWCWQAGCDRTPVDCHQCRPQPGEGSYDRRFAIAARMISGVTNMLDAVDADVGDRLALRFDLESRLVCVRKNE